jgi:hypothetical protein
MNKLKKLLFGILVTFMFTLSVNASSATVSVSSSSSKVVVGNTFTVTIKISSGSYFGTWEFTPSYDSSKLKMTSGSASVKSYGKKKSISYTYKFKAISTGSAKISVKSIDVLDYNEEKSMSLNINPKTVTIITQKELEASYSKDNYLKKLSIDGLTLSPSFKKDTLEYKAEANANTTSINIKATKNHSKASVSGAGKKSVSEGENVFKITVKAQNGSTRTYKVTVNVIDPNPIIVDVDGKQLTVVKRESALTQPDGFEKTTTKINDIDVPAFYNETNKYTLVGLKDSEETNLYIYNAEDNTYKKYYEVDLNELNLYPLPIDKEFGEDYIESNVTVKDNEFDALKLKDSDYYIVNARNLENGEDNYYLYDSVTGTAIRYREARQQPITNTIIKKVSDNDYKQLVIILTAVCGLMMFVTLFALVSKSNSKKKLKKLLNMIEEKQKEAEEKKKQQELKSVEEVTEDENKDIKPNKTNKKKQTKNKAK